MFMNMFANVYKSETTNVSGWYFSGHIYIVKLRIFSETIIIVQHPVAEK